MDLLRYGNVADVHAQLRVLAHAKDSDFTPEFRQTLADHFRNIALEPQLRKLGLKASVSSLVKLLNCLDEKRVSASAIREHADDLDGRLIDELHETTLVALSSQEAAWLMAEQPFGPEVADHFPSCLADALEATRCLALHRNTACVFHCMRVMEVGLRVLGAHLKVPVDHKPGWEAILKKAHGQMSLPNDKKEPAWVREEPFLSDAIAMLTAVKTSWRNTTMHIQKTYTDEDAERIHQAVRGFMVSLAAKLGEA